MNFAIIDENGVVVNVIVADADFAAEIGAIPLPDGMGINDTFDGSEWTKHVTEVIEIISSPTIEDRLTAVEAAILDLMGV